jgi:hypothetical protein
MFSDAYVLGTGADCVKCMQWWEAVLVILWKRHMYIQNSGRSNVVLQPVGLKTINVPYTFIVINVCINLNQQLSGVANNIMLKHTHKASTRNLNKTCHTVYICIYGICTAVCTSKKWLDSAGEENYFLRRNS